MGNELIQTPTSVGAIVPFEQQRVLASAIAASGLFGMKTPEQALVLMALCESEGLHPIRAAQDYHIINGRPSMRAEAMMSRFQAAGGVIRWLDNSDTRCAAMFSHPSSPDPVTIDWDLDRAKKAQLLNNAMWGKYPRAMLRARVISEGIRTVYPGVLSGMYTPEEVRDMGSVEVIETSGPDARVAYDADAADAMIAAFEDAAAMKQWLKDERTRMGWRPGDAAYEALKAACAERAKAINAKPQRTPLNPAPGLPATPESLEAAGFARTPMPFDDALDAIAEPLEAAL